MLGLLLFSLAVIGASDANLSHSNPPYGACLCVFGSVVSVRASACGRVVGQTNTGSCYKYNGQSHSCHLNGARHRFFSLQYGTGGWVVGSYLRVGHASQCGTGHNSGLSSLPSGCPRIITRSEWDARAPKSVVTMQHPTPRVIIHHTEGNSCSNQTACASTVKGVQNLHMNTKKWDDIGYNFLIGGDGRVYEGRGWNRVGAHAKGYNNETIGISFMGSFMNHSPSSDALNVARQLIACGVQQGKISSSYTLHGHRDAGKTICPGDSLYNVIRGWPHFRGQI